MPVSPGPEGAEEDLSVLLEAIGSALPPASKSRDHAEAGLNRLALESIERQPADQREHGVSWGARQPQPVSSFGLKTFVALTKEFLPSILNAHRGDYPMQARVKPFIFGLGKMSRNGAALAMLSAVVLQAASPAQAATVVYTVDGTYDSTGALTGTFDVDTTTDVVSAVDLTLSAAGGIGAMTFTDPSNFRYSLYSSPSFYNLGVEDYDGYNLYLGFQQNGGALASSGFGDSSIGVYFGPSYSISGTITEGVGGVPEPGAWALMLLGTGLAGAELRRRRERTAPTAA